MAAKKATPKKSKPTYTAGLRAMSSAGRPMASLLWRKALAQSIPEVREMLLTHSGLIRIYENIHPEEKDRLVCLSHGHLLEAYQLAEKILIGP